MSGQSILAILAVGMTIAISGVYCWRNIVDPLKAPHVVTWTSLTLLGAVGSGVMISEGAGLASLVLVITTLFNATNAVVGIRKRGRTDVTTPALICFALTVVALAAWLFADSPTTAAILITLAGAVGFTPTVLRTWYQPQYEVRHTYWWNTLRYLLTTLAIANFSIATTLYPASWVLINGGFGIYHTYCLRRQSNALIAIPT